MMDRFLRLAAIVLIAGGAVACGDDDVDAPAGETSTVNVSVYIENGAVDDPIADAVVTLDPVAEGDANLTATTGADGVATFTDVPAGVYTLTHTPATPITNATLTSATEQPLVAQFEGGTTNASFVYSYNPGAVAIQFYRDENDDNAYDPVVDTTLAGFTATLFLGDTLEVASATADSTGALLFDDLVQGDYVIHVLPVAGAEVADSTLDVTVAPGETSDVLIEFTGGEAVVSIAEARALTLGSTVTVQGVVTAGSGVYSSTNVYIQDETAGILLFTGSGGPATDLAPGDTVRVTGSTAAFRQELQIAGGAALTIDVLGSGTVPAPRPVTGGDVNAGDFQGELVVANAVTIDSVGAPFSGGNFNVVVHDAVDTFIVFFDADVGVTPDMVLEGEIYNIAGIMTRFEDDFEIKPRSQADLVLTSNPGGTLDIGVARILADDETATIRGVVVAGVGTFDQVGFYVQDSTGGILVYQGGSADTVVAAVGDSVEVSGSLTTFRSEREFELVTVTSLGAGTVPTPESVDAADVNAGKFQGELVVADSVEVLDVSVSGSGNVTVTVADDAGEFVIFGDVDTGLEGTDFVIGDSYAVTGVLSQIQFDTDEPILYQIKPRSTTDVVGL